MLTKVIVWLANTVWQNGKRRKFLYCLTLLSFGLPTLFIGMYHVVLVDRGLAELALEQRQLLAISAANALREKLDGTSDFISVFAAHPKIRQLVSGEKWNEALEYVKFFQPLGDQSFIDGLFFVDPEGKLTAITPSAPEALGESFAFRDWYRGVQSTGHLYLSEAYQRVNKPQYNVVTIAAPVIGENGLLVGIVGFQMRLSHFAEWSKKINTGSLGIVSIVDQYGHILSHPRYSSEGAIADFSGLPIMKDLQQGKTGTKVLFNSFEREEQVVAYAPVSGYGFGVLVEQAAPAAFAERTKDRFVHIVLLGLLLLWNIFLAYLILLTIEHFEKQ